MVDVLAILEVGVYVFLVNPATYILYKHGKKGLLGWLAIQLFCFVRIIGNILVLKDGTKSETATIVNSIGLSPLILGTVGIIHEAREARHPNLRRGREWFFVANLHGLLSVGMTLIVVGIMHVMDGTETKTTKFLMKLGMSLMVLSFFIVVAWLIWSLTDSQNEPGAPAHAEGSVLMRSIVVALPFIGVRLVYGIITFVDLLNNKSNAAIATKNVYKYILGAAPELAVVTTYCSAGLMTRHIKQAFKSAKYISLDPARPGDPLIDQVPLRNVPPLQNTPYEPYR